MFTTDRTANAEQIRAAINSRPITDFYPLELSQHNKYCCPLPDCRSGHGKNKTGALSISKENKVTCFSCGKIRNEDTLGALRLIWDCSEREAFEKCGYYLEGNTWKASERAPKPVHNTVKQEREPEQLEDNSLFYRQAHEALLGDSKALEYLHKRGISDRSIDLFKLGYAAAWRHPKAPTASHTKRIIIPRSDHTYLARQIGAGNAEKIVVGTQSTLYNARELLQDAIDIVHICEGELDTISLYQAGAAAAIGICSTTNAHTAIDVIRQHPEKVYLLELDNDNPGRAAQAEIEHALAESGIKYISADTAELFGGEKDPNAAYIRDSERLKEHIKALEERARELIDRTRPAEPTESKGVTMLDTFLRTVKARTYEPIPTGIIPLDAALSGGLIRGTLVTLGAPPAAGKTILAQQIMENMAKNGADCLYINLEMSREQLFARSISRYAYRLDRLSDLTALDVLRGYAWSAERERLIMRAAAYYNAEIGDRLTYPDGVTNELGAVMKAIERETKRLEAAGRPAPLICVDYLQLIDGGAGDAAESLKRSIYRLKDYARQHNTIVLLIIANNRTANKSGNVEVDSGRDTSAIEYTGDVMLGLAYTAIEERRPKPKDPNTIWTLDEIRKERALAFKTGKPPKRECNEITIKVLKNRFGGSDRGAAVELDGAHSCIKTARP